MGRATCFRFPSASERCSRSNRAGLDTEGQRVVGMLPASRVRLELNRRALRAVRL